MIRLPKSRLPTSAHTEFCQVSPGPVLRSACGPGYEAIYSWCVIQAFLEIKWLQEWINQTWSGEPGNEARA